MFRTTLAVAFATALTALCPLPGHAGFTINLAVAPQETVPVEVANRLDDWLDAHSPWPRREMPVIRLIDMAEALDLQGATASLQRGRLRGLYDPDAQEILLVTPWDADNIADRGVLLHELVHHRQAPHHWYCPAAQELSAYRLQANWMAEQGAKADINWVAVVLDAGCTRRDIHPD